MAFKSFANLHGIPFKLLNALFSEVNEEIRQIWQQEALEMLADWMSQNPDANPNTRSLFDQAGFPFTYARLSGTGSFKPSPQEEKSYIFSSRFEYLSRLREYLKLREGKSPKLLFSRMNLDDMEPWEREEVRKVQQEESAELLMEWYAEHPDLELNWDNFLKYPPGVSWSRLTATGPYRKSEKMYKNRIFDSKEHMRAFLKQKMLEACENGLTKVNTKSPQPSNK